MQETNQPAAAMVYKATLKTKYGLTDKLIRLLGEPDKLVKNPHYKSGPSAGLYSVERVEKFVSEYQAEVEHAKAKRGKRKEAAEKAVQTKVENVVRFVEHVTLKIAPLPKTYSELQRIAARHAHARYGAEAREPGYNGVVSTVRHEFTNYHEILAAFEGKVGAGRGMEPSPAYDALRQRLDEEVEKAICQAYPFEFTRDE